MIKPGAAPAAGSETIGGDFLHPGTNRRRHTLLGHEQRAAKGARGINSRRIGPPDEPGSQGNRPAALAGAGSASPAGPDSSARGPDGVLSNRRRQGSRQALGPLAPRAPLPSH